MEPAIVSDWITPIGLPCRAYRQIRHLNGTVTFEYCGQAEGHTGGHTPIMLTPSVTASVLPSVTTLAPGLSIRTG